MASVSNFRNGMAIKHNGSTWIVNEFQHVKPGKGQAFIRTKLKQFSTGKVVEHTFRLSDNIVEVRLEEKEMQYLYASGEDLCFMDNETYDQLNLPKQMIGDQMGFLKEGDLAKVQFLDGQAVRVSLPMFITLKVTEAAPGVKGDTVSNLQKTVTLETGTEIQVPLFIKEGDTLKIDTRDGRYVERASS